MAKSDRLKDPLAKVSNLLSHILDQSAAEHRDAGEEKKAEADKKLGKSLDRLNDVLGRICDTFDRRLKRNDDLEAQGLPPLTIEEQVELDKREGFI